MTRLLLCAGACFLSLGLLIPVIPRYVTGPLEQGPVLVGGCLASTSVCALLARPMAGRLADRRGRGVSACVGACLPAAASLAVLLADPVGGERSRTRRTGPLVHRAGLIPGLAYWASVWGYTAFSVPDRRARAWRRRAIPRADVRLRHRGRGGGPGGAAVPSLPPQVL